MPISLFRNCMFVALLIVLGGCATAYHLPSDRQIASCKDFESVLGKKLTKQLDGHPLPSVQMEMADIADDYRVVPSDDPDAVVRPLIVRFSESGNLVNRCDYSKVLHVIRRIKEEKVILIFVHGWQNDSGSKQNLVYNFNEDRYPQKTLGSDLEQFSRLAGRVAVKTKRPVVPVYISWKGGTGLPIIRHLTFWDRKGASDRMSRNGDFSRLLGAIENIDDAQQMKVSGKKSGAETRSYNQIVLIGHSFGSRILFSTVVKDLVVRAQRAYPVEEDGVCKDSNREMPDCEKVQGETEPPPTYEKIKGPADLIILFNPALDAAAYRSIDEFSFSGPRFRDDQSPLMMIFQSRSDKAVGMAFPVGQFFGGQFGSLRGRGIGFWPDYWTHKMCKSGTNACDDRKLTGVDNRFPQKVVGKDSNGKNVRYEVKFFDRKALIGPHRLPERKVQDSPFYVIQVEEDVLDGHVWFNPSHRRCCLVGSDDEGGAFKEWLVELVSARSEEFFAQPR